MQRTVASIMITGLICAFSLPGGTIARGPSLGCVTPTSIVIRWTTSESARGEVKYGMATLNGSAKDTALTTVHTVTVSGLIPSSTYRYCVISGTDTSAVYAFATAVRPGEPFIFGAYGDTRRGGQVRDSAHVKVLRQMLKHNVRFAIHSGDLVSRNTEANWDDYFDCTTRATSFGCSVPIFSVMGNHDKGQMYYDNSILPRNPNGTSSYYSFNYGSVHFTAINTLEEYEKPDSPQYQWIATDLASPEAQGATFRIVFLHHPPYTSLGGHASDMNVRAVLSPLFEQNGVDIVFAGHNHFYERSVPVNGTVYIVAGAAGAPLYDFKSKEPFSAFQEKASHFCKLSVERDTMRLWMIREDGEVRDSLVIANRSSRH
jgi:predicted phosphodiesterase